jgi:hypothetical protein
MEKKNGDMKFALWKGWWQIALGKALPQTLEKKKS